MSLKWYPTKEILMQNKSLTDHVILAQDVCTTVSTKYGMKRYSWFQSTSMLASYLEDQKQLQTHYYEIVPNVTDHPTYMYFDLDKPDDIQSSLDIDVFITTFCKTLIRFTKHVYDIDINESNLSVTYTPNPIKLSSHVRADIKINNLTTMANVVSNLNRFIFNNIHTNNQDRETLTYYKPNNEFPMSVVDTSVYKKFVAFRCVYSSKYKGQDSIPLKLIPYKSNSTRVQDHLVLFDPVHDSLNCIDQSINFDPPINYTTVSQINVLTPISLHLPLPLPLPIQGIQEGIQDIQDIQNNSAINPDHLFKVEQYLKDNAFLQDTFKCENIQFKYNKSIKPHVYIFALDKNIRHHCPCANRIHRHNRSAIYYYHKKHVAYYKCFNVDCKEKIKSNQYVFRIPIQQDIDAISISEAMSNRVATSLHCKVNIIPWTIKYNEPRMQNYPLYPLVAVRANMGIGKTEIMIREFLPNYIDQDHRCIFITYQRILSKKYSQELHHLGFVNYLDIADSTITAAKVIVCIDSICRIATSIPFDFVIIDEVTSVLLHFNSKFLTKSSTVCTMFECMLLRANQIIVLDACVDNTISYDFVKHIADKKAITPYYIKNEHVRETNRECNIHTNKKGKTTSVLVKHMTEYIIKQLANNKKIVVTSSTKSYVEELSKFISHSLPDKVQVVMHSENNDLATATNATANATATNATTTTTNTITNFYERLRLCDIFIYSPTITAGISIEFPHFDELVSFIDNTLYTPPVDIILQQMFRVRQLVDGQMNLYVNDTMKLKPTNYPYTPHEVDKFLDSNTNHDNNLFMQSHQIIADNQVVYDKSLLSYTLLRGILVNRNKSLLHFEEILINTLQSDYNIECTILPIQTSKSIMQKAKDLKAMLKELNVKTTFTFSPALLIDESAYKQLESKSQSGEKLSEIEQQQKWTYYIMHAWTVFDRVDAAFFEKFIGQARSFDMADKIETFNKMKRLKYMMTNNVDGNRVKFQTVVQNIMQEEEFNIKLFNATIRKSFSMLIEGHKLMEFLTDYTDMIQGQTSHSIVYRTVISKGETIVINKDVFYKRVKKWIESMNPNEFKMVVDLFDGTKHFDDQNKMLTSTRKQTSLVVKILSHAFGIQMVNDHHGLAYTSKIITSKFHEISTKYEPIFMNFQIFSNTYSFHE